ncbi:MAG: EpsG family protein [Campylobacterales bacterium]|nr:EpsG family protein [Campylobacterales bacterium]
MFPFEASFPYIFTLFFFLVLSFYKKIKSKNDIDFIVFFNLVIVFYLYQGEFSDWRTYRDFVNSCPSIGCTYFEPLYDFLTYFASITIGFDLIKIFSLVLIFYALKNIKKLNLSNVEYFIAIFSIFLVFLPLYYGAVRQSISFSFLLISFTSFFLGKKYIASFWLLGAIGFHFSALVIAPALLGMVIFWKLSNRKLLKFCIILLSAAAALSLLMSYFSDYMALIDSFNPGTRNAVYDPVKTTIILIERALIIMMCLTVLYYFSGSRKIVFFSLISLTGAIFYIVVFKFSLNTAGRVTAFFRLADIFVVYYAIRLFLSGFRPLILDRINVVALISTGFFILIKFYFTIVSVGFFR